MTDYTADYIRAKFFGPTDTKGSRYKVVCIKGINSGKSSWECKNYSFSLIYDQFEAQGWVHLFDDNGWSYFKREA